MLADAVLARVHQRGDLVSVRAALGVGDGRDLGRPRARRDGDDGADPVPDPGVDDGGQVAGPGQVPLADRGGQDLPRSRPASSAPRRVRHSHFAWWPGSRRYSGGRWASQQVPVALLAGRGGLVGPDRVQNGQVIGVGQGLLPGLGRGQLLAVSVQHPG